MAGLLNPTTEQLMDAHLDITAVESVQIEVKDDNSVLWINVDGICVLRICRITRLELPIHVMLSDAPTIIAFRKLRESWFQHHLVSKAGERDWIGEDSEALRKSQNTLTKELYDRQTQAVLDGKTIPERQLFPMCFHDMREDEQ